MASGPRRKLEPFKKYRERLKEEHILRKFYLRGRMIWPGNYIDKDGKVSREFSAGKSLESIKAGSS